MRPRPDLMLALRIAGFELIHEREGSNRFPTMHFYAHVYAPFPIPASPGTGELQTGTGSTGLYLNLPGGV